MFCQECGNQESENAKFCRKCGAKLIKNQSAAQTFVASKPEAPVSGSTENVALLLEQNASRCSAIKAVTQAKNGTVLKGTVRKYLVLITAAGQAVVVPSLAFPFIILDVITYGLICMVACNIGWDFAEYGSLYFEDYGLLLAIGLFVGGLIKTIIPFLGRKEKETVATYIREIIEPEGMSLTPGAVKMRPSAARLAASIVPAVIGAVMLIFVMAENGLISFGMQENDFEFGDIEEVYDDAVSTVAENFSLSQTYTNEEEGFSFMYPADWTVDENSTAVVGVAAPAGLLGVKANIYVGKTDADETYLSATMSDFEALLSYEFDNFRMISLTDYTLSGHSARKLVYTCYPNGVGVTQIAYFYIVDSDMYCVCCSSLESLFDKYEPVFDAVMDTYTITATMDKAYTGSFY